MRTRSLHSEVLQAGQAESSPSTPGALVRANLQPKAATVVPAQLLPAELPVYADLEAFDFDVKIRKHIELKK